MTLTLRCDRWGSVELGDLRLRARGRIGMLVWEGRIRRPHRVQVYPEPRAPAEPRRTARHTARDRRARGPRQRGRPRVRRHARLRPRRSPAIGQLAGERPARRADRQRAASRIATPTSSSSWTASRRRAAATTGDGTLERAVRAAATLAGRLPRASRPRRAGHVRRRPPVARAPRRSRAALPPDRRPARDRRRVQLRVEGRQHHPCAHAAAEGARDRRDAAARRARDRCAVRSSRPRSRPRDRGGVTGGASCRRVQASMRWPIGCGSCAAPSCGRASSARASPWPAGRDELPLGRRDRGGEGISPSRATLTALTLGAASVGARGRPRRPGWLSLPGPMRRSRSPASAPWPASRSSRRSRPAGPSCSQACSCFSAEPTSRSSRSTIPRSMPGRRSWARRCSRSESWRTSRWRPARP